MDKDTINILSLCSGVGGIELGLKLAIPNARTICYVEGETYCCEVLAKKMEQGALAEAPIWSDVKTFDGRKWSGKVHILSGGYPCQPFSVAGKRLAEKDPRHLWPEFARIIREVKPPICFFENVGGHLRLGFESVANDLRKMGYKVKAGLFTASEVGAPHKRERLFILAYNNEFGCDDGRNNISERQICENFARSLSQNKSCRRKSQFRARKNGKNLAYCNEVVSKRSFNGRNSKGKQKEKTCQRSDNVADLESSRSCKNFKRVWEKHNGSCKKSKLENSKCLGYRGRNNGVERWKSRKAKTSRPLCSYCKENKLPIWPPKPEDFRSWDRISTNLKPAILRTSDGLAHRVDRVRACGNGVVPLVCAYAWRTLTTGMYIKKTERRK
ncbi:MAG: DNA cytosine methyltransferase [Alphaproteobacteria bacterium]|nr:DNA cytosine methyltransferase [Alphaproteobacteria bacterium]